MVIPPGTRLGSYEVQALIAQGGMGEVYRARDLKLGRDVALKILPLDLTSDPERLARLETEARTLAALNHPNISAIYGLEDTNGICALVLELVDGDTLAQRIRRGALPLEEALSIARGIGHALDAAHERGIIHRDLKPQNVALTRDGTVKVLDFGLAKMATDVATPYSSHAPTIADGVSADGAIVGTVGYMSPEQARGQPVDRRTDIWAFGCVLYEMLAARPAFARQTISDTFAGILEREPDWTALPDNTPPSLRRVLSRCLQKDVRLRRRDIGDVIHDLEDVATADRVPARRSQRRLAEYVAATAVASGILGALGALLLTRNGEPASPVLRTAIVLADGTDLVRRGREYPLAVSPDGKRLAYVARAGTQTALHVRELNVIEPVAIVGSEDARSPFFSPDGQWVAFFANGTLRKAPVEGGTPIDICKVTGIPMGGDWVEDTIVFGTYQHGLSRVSARGGVPQVLYEAQLAVWPEILPDQQNVLFTFSGSVLLTIPLQGGSPRVVARRSDEFVGSAASAEWLQAPARDAPRLGSGWLLQARYVPSGHVVYGQGAGLVRAVAFDVSSLTVTGTPVTPLDSVYAAPGTGAVYFATSDNGSLVYNLENRKRELVWVDRTGRATPVGFEAQAFRFVALSPDGGSIAAVVDSDLRISDIWVYDILRRTRTRLTTDRHNLEPLWSPEGTHVWFWRGGPLVSKATVGDAPIATIIPDGNRVPRSWSSDGRVLLFEDWTPEEGVDIWELTRDAPVAHRPLLARPADDYDATFSPDGRWVAYVSDESGSPEIFVAPYPRLEQKVVVSSSGGSDPVWSRDGRELFYRQGPSVMSVLIERGARLQAGEPKMLFEGSQYAGAGNDLSFDVDRHGRFLMPRMVDSSAPRQLIIVQNWFRELERLAERK